jgi:anti-sigma B factor antagonist
MAIVLQNHDQANYSVLVIDGKFNAVTVSEIRKAADCVAGLGIKNLVLDFSRTTTLDSAGIGCIMSIQKHFGSINGKVYLASLSPNISSLLKSSAVNRVLNLIPSVSDAESMLNAGVIRQERGFYALFKLPAEFSLTAVKPLRQSIDESKGKGYVNMVFDFERCKAITSVGIGLLVNLHKDLSANGGGLYLLNVSEEIRSIMEATNILTVLQVFTSLEDIEEKVMPKSL